MNHPEFPKEFVKNHCPKVLEAKQWRKVYNVEETDEDDLIYAECAFRIAGNGLKCENCALFIGTSEVYPRDKWLEPIRQYYRSMEEHDKEVVTTQPIETLLAKIKEWEVGIQSLIK